MISSFRSSAWSWSTESLGEGSNRLCEHGQKALEAAEAALGLGNPQNAVVARTRATSPLPGLGTIWTLKQARSVMVE